MEIVRASFTPAAVGSAETAVCYRIASGERVVWTSTKLSRPAAAASTATATIGDGSDVDGFVTTSDLSLTASAGAMANGSGAYLANSGGKLYTTSDTVDVTYAPGGDPKTTAPIIAVAIGVARDWLPG